MTISIVVLPLSLGILLPLRSSVVYLSACGPRFSQKQGQGAFLTPSHGSAIAFLAVALIQIRK